MSPATRLKLTCSMAWLLEVDLLSAAYKDLGILQYQDLEVSGEEHLLKHVLPKLFADKATTIFDVGANIGDYSLSVKQALPNAEIYAFDPNSATFSELENNVKQLGIHCIQQGLSAKQGKQSQFTPTDNLASGHASLYRDVLTQLHGNETITTEEVQMTTVDAICTELSLDFVHFLKIDTEGHELAVLQGAQRMITEGRIGAIQFEFNEMNVISRVFLRDFFELLKDYQFFRLHKNGLLQIDYSPRWEIFQFQNLFAIHRKIYETIDLTSL